MSYYGNEPWPAPARQPSWEQQQQQQPQPQQPPSRSGTASAGSREEPNAFAYQLAEVDRAIDNLMKSGKFPMMGFPGPGPGPRRDPVPLMTGRTYQDFDPRVGPSPRPGSMGEFDGMRSQSNTGLQNFYSTQRYGRNAEADQAMQARRRQAAQRERELRNYHQEQQYQKHASSAKSDRSMSPNAGMTEEERRDLIARQHRALYGNDSTLYSGDTSRPISQDARVAPSMTGGLRGGSPLAYDPFGMQSQNNAGESAVQMPPRDQAQKNVAQRSRANSTSSPSSNPTTSFSLFENAQQSSRTSTSSPTGGSPPRDSTKATTAAGVAPIGTRPTQSQAQSGSTLQKRSTTPLPSPLSFGFTASDQTNNERSTSASSNPNVADKPVGLGWGNNSGVWGTSKGPLGVQASVWG